MLHNIKFTCHLQFLHFVLPWPHLALYLRCLANPIFVVSHFANCKILRPKHSFFVSSNYFCLWFMGPSSFEKVLWYMLKIFTMFKQYNAILEFKIKLLHFFQNIQNRLNNWDLETWKKKIKKKFLALFFCFLSSPHLLGIKCGLR